MSDPLKTAMERAETSKPEVELPLRVKYLMEGAKITNGDRNGAYGEPRINLGCAGELKEIIRKYINRARLMHPGELEAVDQVLTKVARIATGAAVKKDNYIDGANYFAIAGEIAAYGAGPQPGQVVPLTEEELANLQKKPGTIFRRD